MSHSKYKIKIIGHFFYRLSRIPKNTLSEEINRLKQQKHQADLAMEQNRSMLNKIDLKEGQNTKIIDYFSDDWQ